VVHGDKINEAIEREILAGATEENSDKTLREWVKKDYCVFARTTPAQSKKKKKKKYFFLYHKK
jgi:sodium/potassium-transporting ATPase subunit alpha